MVNRKTNSHLTDDSGNTRQGEVFNKSEFYFSHVDVVGPGYNNELLL